MEEERYSLPYVAGFMYTVLSKTSTAFFLILKERLSRKPMTYSMDQLPGAYFVYPAQSPKTVQQNRNSIFIYQDL
ncbi:MAG: hypothetical protein EGQ74_17955 [Bacteroides nordii]|jgi:hypothetical protein|nr:hypothetical protein [Bacteroides nordii]